MKFEYPESMNSILVKSNPKDYKIKGDFIIAILKVDITKGKLFALNMIKVKRKNFL